MKKLIDNNDIILDGTASRTTKENEAFTKLEVFERLCEMWEIDNFSEVFDAFKDYYHKKRKVIRKGENNA